MREFQCNKCLEVNTLYHWNVSEKVYRNFTLHEIKDFDDFKDLRKTIIFHCPSCKKKSVADEISEMKFV